MKQVGTIAALCGLLGAVAARGQEPVTQPASAASFELRPAVTPATATAVTTTGGTTGYVPRFSGAATVVNSLIYDTGTTVGIGVGATPNSSVKLDVGGGMIVRGNTIVSRTGNATSSQAYPSWAFDFFSNVYNSSTKSAANPFFSLQSEPTGNNTASPSATFNLLFSSNGAAAETGFYVNPNGTIHFSPSQTFPIAAGPQGPTGPTGPAGPAGPTGPSGPVGPAAPQYFTSTSLLQPFTSNADQYDAVVGINTPGATNDYSSQFKSSVVFANACTVSNLQVNLGYESITKPFIMTTALSINGSNTPLSCDTGFADGYGLSCTASGTYAIPAGSLVVLHFSHTGTNPSNIYPHVTFTCQ